MAAFYVLRMRKGACRPYVGAGGMVRTIYEAKQYPTLRDALKEASPKLQVLRIKESPC